MDYRHFLPNLCTSMNLVFGVCSLLSTYNNDLVWGSLFILLALVADGLDGRTARFFGVSSEMGKEMDSLCDLGSVGIAPGFLAWAFVLHNYGLLGIAVVVLFAVCGMWRLARFNVNASVVHGYFMGLAIPAGGNIVALDTPGNLKEKNSDHRIVISYLYQGKREEQIMGTLELKDSMTFAYDEIISIHSQEPTLEDVFIQYTGRGLS